MHTQHISVDCQDDFAIATSMHDHLQFLCGHILEGRLLLGNASGRRYMLDLATGKPVTAPPVAAAAIGRVGGTVTVAAAAAVGSSDHDGPVMCISASVYLQHYVTASQDGYVKVWDHSMP